MPQLGVEIVRGLGLSTAVALIGVRRRALAPTGAVAATVIGTAIYTAGGFRWSNVLLTFFVSSSVLSRRTADAPAGSGEMAARGSQRDHVQALSNGGVAGALALAFVVHGSNTLAAAYAGSLAAATADTWATEIGSTSLRTPRSILSGRAVPPGTSGGVTSRGTVAALAGAASIAMTAAASVESLGHRHAYGAIFLAGFTGAIVDSVAGATIQAGYQCPECLESTERRVHRCGAVSSQVKGWRWCTNDVVNLMCTGAGALMAACLYRGQSRQDAVSRR